MQAGYAASNVNTFLHQIRSLAERSRRYSQRHFKLLGAIAVITLPLYTVVENFIGDPSFNTVYIRILAGCAGIPLLFHDKLPAPLQANLDWIWIGSTAFILPYSFGVILTLNAAYADPDVIPSPIWVYQYLVALFIFIQLINHGALSTLLWGIATIGVFMTCLMVESPNFAALREVWLYPLPVYLTALIVGSITNRNVHIVQSEQLRAASAIGSNIAHELRTPLASIRIRSRAIGRFLPTLLEGYERARAAKVPVGPITTNQLRQLSTGAQSIQAEVDYSNTIIDMLLANTQEAPVTDNKVEEFPASEVIEEAVSRFPFNNSNERNLLSYSVHQNFAIFAPRTLVVHVLFNLIKNALYFVQRGGHGHIDIVARAGRGNNFIEVIDTGTGVPPSLQPRIFDRFFSSDPASQGAGIGLSFCKTVMQSIGGEIRCESLEGEYTRFQLTFPVVNPRKNGP